MDNRNDFPYWWAKCKRVKHDLSRMQLATEYAKANNLHISTVVYRIIKRKIVGYKLQGRWYVFLKSS